MQSLAERLEKGGVLSLDGVDQAAQPFLAVALRVFFPTRPILVVLENLKIQENFFEDIETWSARVVPRTSHFSPRTSFYPSWGLLPDDSRLPHVDVVSDRMQALMTLSEGGRGKDAGSPIVVTSAAALMERTFTPEALRARTRALKRGEQADPLGLAEWLEEQGYEPEAQVSQKGEISLRGGILDVFPPTEAWPVRLEFFGDELESLRQFDPITQVSREEITHVVLPPAGEFGLLRKLAGEASDKAGALLGSFLDYLPADTIVLLPDPARLAVDASDSHPPASTGSGFVVGWDDVLGLLAVRNMARVELMEGDASQFSSLDAYRPVADRPPEQHVAEIQRREFFNQIHRWLRQGYAVHVFCNNEGERRRFEEIRAELGMAEKPDESTCRPVTHLGTLSRGFVCDPARLVVVTDAEIFGRYKLQRPRRLKSAHAQSTRSALEIDFSELEPGDLVVHVQHGIARYLGLQQMPLGTRPDPVRLQPSTAPAFGPECLVLEFAATDAAQPAPKLYVPVSEAHLVSKYVGSGKARPPLNTLGGTRWAKAMKQAESAVRDVASDLLSIQAARESQPGHAFAPDVPWQREFESAFIFEETPDQVTAIQQTKADMERAKPMDRLICGDVGFGKTEVAIRAAFKAVMDGRQVAVLVPTTVLAQQHFNTFRERMADYPIRIELLSRFRTRRQQDLVVRDLGHGAVDIVIGTHRLLQGDIRFKDLGLVIIDEEQRFGVMHKETFKMFRKLVDVLTLSATPIPRTLYLALSGARDMSTIQTPPHDRLPVETIVTQYDERVIRDAIQRELQRGGQVFFLHNRVLTIHTVAQKLRALAPQARIVVGHGQMHSDELEEVMTAFVNGDADVLLSTTIIESGLDIPNANTIIIDRADRFGLSDLYQLRGRVGRYKHQAFAYMLLPRHAGLLSDVRKRIGAIKQYSTLGSGFKIAMRDLEIRGAGNLLGAEQSGHITAVGFELYCQLLKQSIAGLKGEKVKPRVQVEVKIDFISTGDQGNPRADSRGDKSAQDSSGLLPQAPAGLPQDYVPEPQHRIEMYRKLAQASDKAALEGLARELRDRFGPLPAPVDLLLQIAELKILAAERGISTIEVKDDRLMLTRNADYITLGGKFPRLTKKTAPTRLKEIKKLLLAL